MPLIFLIATVLLLAAKDDGPSSSSSSPPLTPDDPIEMSCDEAIDHLPESMRFAVAAAIHASTDVAALVTLANALETAAAAQPAPYLRAALLVASHCVRERAIMVGGTVATPTSSSSMDPGAFAPAPSPGPSASPSPSPAPSASPSAPSSLAAPSATSSSFASSSTVPSATGDGSAPIFGRMDATEQSAARIGATYAARPVTGTALRR